MDLSGTYICIKRLSYSFRLIEQGDKVNIIKSPSIFGQLLERYYLEDSFGHYLDEEIINNHFKSLSSIRKEKINKLING